MINNDVEEPLSDRPTKWKKALRKFEHFRQSCGQSLESFFTLLNQRAGTTGIPKRDFAKQLCNLVGTESGITFSEAEAMVHECGRKYSFCDLSSTLGNAKHPQGRRTTLKGSASAQTLKSGTQKHGGCVPAPIKSRRPSHTPQVSNPMDSCITVRHIEQLVRRQRAEEKVLAIQQPHTVLAPLSPTRPHTTMPSSTPTTHATDAVTYTAQTVHCPAATPGGDRAISQQLKDYHTVFPQWLADRVDFQSYYKEQTSRLSTVCPSGYIVEQILLQNAGGGDHKSTPSTNTLSIDAHGNPKNRKLSIRRPSITPTGTLAGTAPNRKNSVTTVPGRKASVLATVGRKNSTTSTRKESMKPILSHPDGDRKAQDLQIVCQWLRFYRILLHVPIHRLVEVCRQLRLLTYPAGTEIITQGDPGDAFYVVFEGSCTVTIDNAAIGTVSVGSVFGEKALENNTPRTATVITQQTCKLMVLMASDYKSLAASAQAATNSHRFNFLRTHGGELFNNVMFSDAKLTCIVKTMTERSYQTGETIMSQTHSLLPFNEASEGSTDFDIDLDDDSSVSSEPDFLAENHSLFIVMEGEVQLVRDIPSSSSHASIAPSSSNASAACPSSLPIEMHKSPSSHHTLDHAVSTKTHPLVTCPIGAVFGEGGCGLSLISTWQYQDPDVTSKDQCVTKQYGQKPLPDASGTNEYETGLGCGSYRAVAIGSVKVLVINHPEVKQYFTLPDKAMARYHQFSHLLTKLTRDYRISNQELCRHETVQKQQQVTFNSLKSTALGPKYLSKQHPHQHGSQICSPNKSVHGVGGGGSRSLCSSPVTALHSDTHLSGYPKLTKLYTAGGAGKPGAGANVRNSTN